MPFTRVFDADRKAQGFRSQMHLDAFYASYDHVKDCPECGRPALAVWLEGSASWQPTETRCAEAHRLDAITHEISRCECCTSMDDAHNSRPCIVCSHYTLTVAAR